MSEARELLEAVKQWLTHVEYWHQEGRSSEGRRCTDCERLERLARTAIDALAQPEGAQTGAARGGSID